MKGESRPPFGPSLFSCTLPIMPRYGATLLSDVRGPVLTVVCEPCGRRERYDVERLIRQYGWDAKLTDLRPALTVDCPKRGSVSGIVTFPQYRHFLGNFSPTAWPADY